MYEMKCKKCNCNGNVDPNDIGNCNTLTGECLKCINNTVNGADKKCELCAKGYYGDAVNGNCSACGCFPNGTQIPPDYKAGDEIPCDYKGNCACRRNVIGKRCDQCPAGHWNVGSGVGCEKCKCHPEGSESNNCNLVTGQCKCKPGVDGRTCDQCATGHYKFSPTGCIACNCHPDGSKHQNCTSKGVCECLPGVLGIKCDQCPENKYNLSVGCISCPKCFDLIQVAVNELREKMSTFNFSSGNISAGSVNIKDKDFEEAVRLLKEKIDALKKKVEMLMKEDTELAKLFKFLTEQFTKLTSSISELEKMLEKSEDASKLGQTEIKKAESIIDLIKKLLEEVEKKLEEEGGKIGKKSSSGGGDIGDMSKRMREIAGEARKLADKHEEDAATIKMTTDMALNSSAEAYKKAKEARDKEVKLEETLRKYMLDAEEAKRLANESERLIMQANTSSTLSLSEAEKLIEDAKKPLPDLNVTGTKASAEKVTKEAQEMRKDINEMLNDNKEGIKQLDSDDLEARMLMKKGYKLRNDSNALYDIAKNASDQAKKAQEDGLKVAREAKDMLKTLEGFETQIQQSKANATEAKKLIPLIKKLIAEANKTAAEAARNADMSQDDATKSLKTIKEGNSTAHRTKEDVNDMLDEAKKILKDLMDFMMGPLNDTKQDIKGLKSDLKKYEKKAEEDSVKVQKAHNDSIMAIDSATMAQVEVTKSLEEVEDLMTAIASLDEIDYATLEKAEKALKKADDKIDGKISLEIDALQKKVIEQQKRISFYELDLSELRKQVAHTEALYEFMPKQCFRVAGDLEETKKSGVASAAR